MIPVHTMAGQIVAVFGLGQSGRATCRALAAGGATALAWDDNADARAAVADELGDLSDLRDVAWPDIAALVLAPGVPLTHPEPHWTVQRAHAAGVPVIGDVELFARERATVAPFSPFIAITGTNGKSTTTALLSHVLKVAGWDVQMGGNIGVPILDLAPPVPNPAVGPHRIHVVELSSYQIDLMPTLTPTIGMVLNVSPDHIDRHGTVENYAAIKARVATSAAQALVSQDDVWCRGMADACRSRHVACLTVSLAEPDARAATVTANGGVIRMNDKGATAVPLADISGIATLRGSHNLQNAAFAAAAAHQLGVSSDSIQHGLASFPGLAHRMEEIGRVGRVAFVNDSKATNADSADKALGSFPPPIYWIAGGRAKAGGIAPLAHHFPRIAKAYLIGESAADFAETLDGRVPSTICGTLDVAISAAARDAAADNRPEAVVLLAPACASFDQFASFEARGEAFCEAVRQLPGFRSARPAGADEAVR